MTNKQNESSVNKVATVAVEVEEGVEGGWDL